MIPVKERIIQISDEILEYLLEYKKKNPDFTCSLRSRDSVQSTEKRLENGQWFQGSDYIYVPLFKKGDSARKIKTIGFRLNFDKKENSVKNNSVHISFKDGPFSEKDIEFHKELAAKLKISLNEKNFGDKFFDDESDYISNLQYYLDKVRPLANELLQKHDIAKNYIVSEQEFNEHLSRIRDIKENQVNFKVEPDNINALIEQYKKKLKSEGLSDEKYKWELLSKYKNRPDITSDDFFQEIYDIDFSNLVYGIGIGVTRELAKKKSEEYRSCFEVLFDEKKELQKRLNFFKDETLKIYRELQPDTTKSHHQDERTIYRMERITQEEKSHQESISCKCVPEILLGIRT